MYKCECGHTFGDKAILPFYCACGRKYDGEKISLLQKVVNFSKALINHALSGFPKATEEQIEERWKICQACPFLRNEECMKCGCSCPKEMKFKNKLVWADQECPEGKWKKIEK